MALIFYGWWIVLACFLVALYVGGVLSYGFTAFFDPIVEEFGWSYTQVSIAFALRGLEMGILSPVTGVLVDRFGSRKLAFSGALIVGSALILLGMTNSLLMFYSACVLLALGHSATASTVLMTAVAHWFRKNVGKAMGFVACGFGVGGIFIPFIVWLIDMYQWRTAFIVLGVAMWALGIPLSFVHRHRPEEYGYSPDGEMALELDSIPEDEHPEQDVYFREAVRSGNFWKVCTAESIRIMITMAVITHVMPYLNSIGMSRGRAALVATGVPLLSIIGRFGFGWLGDIYDKKYVLTAAYILLGLGMLAFAYIHVGWLVLLFLLLFPAALGGTVPLRAAIIREYFGTTAFGKLIGMLFGVGAIGAVIGPTAAGWSFDNLGGYQPGWLVLAGTSVFAIVLVLRIKAPARTREEEKWG